jgi:hypothetical protein
MALRHVDAASETKTGMIIAAGTAIAIACRPTIVFPRAPRFFGWPTRRSDRHAVKKLDSDARPEGKSNRSEPALDHWPSAAHIRHQPAGPHAWVIADLHALGNGGRGEFGRQEWKLKAVRGDGSGKDRSSQAQFPFRHVLEVRCGQTIKAALQKWIARLATAGAASRQGHREK